MKSNYYIKHLSNISPDSIQDEMMASDFIITKRGSVRDSISFIGEENFVDNKVLDLEIDDVEKELESNEVVEKVKISVDISLVDRKSLAKLFSIIARLSLKQHYEVCIVYALAKYSPPSGSTMPNTLVKPVSNFFTGWSTRPGMPVLSIVGLGYEKDKAIGAIEFLESSKSFLFIPKSKEEEFYSDVMEENGLLLDKFGEDNRFIYQLESPVDAIYSLDAAISASKNDYKVALLPFGPKLFYALSLLASIPHPEVSVWYVSGESEDNDTSQDRAVSSILGFKFSIVGK